MISDRSQYPAPGNATTVDRSPFDSAAAEHFVPVALLFVFINSIAVAVAAAVMGMR